MSQLLFCFCRTGMSVVKIRMFDGLACPFDHDHGMPTCVSTPQVQYFFFVCLYFFQPGGRANGPEIAQCHIDLKLHRQIKYISAS